MSVRLTGQLVKQLSPEIGLINYALGYEFTETYVEHAKKNIYNLPGQFT